MNMVKSYLKKDNSVLKPFKRLHLLLGDIEINIEERKDNNNKTISTTNLDRIQLSIFSHRFMSIAEQMGRCGI